MFTLLRKALAAVASFVIGLILIGLVLAATIFGGFILALIGAVFIGLVLILGIYYEIIDDEED